MVCRVLAAPEKLNELGTGIMNLKNQSGMNSILLVYVLLLSAAFLAVVLKGWGPVYQSYSVKEGLMRLVREYPNDLDSLSKSQIRQTLSKHYSVNGVWGPVTQVLEVERLKEKTLIKIEYEDRVELFLNIDIVFKYNFVLDTSRPEECCKPSESK